MHAEARSAFEESSARYGDLLRLNPHESRVKTGLAMVERNLAELGRELERKERER